MNKRGGYLGIGLAIFLWILGILVMPFITSTIDSERVNLACSDTSISFGTKLICLTHDTIIPYFLWTLFVLCLGLVVGGDS